MTAFVINPVQFVYMCVYKKNAITQLLICYVSMSFVTLLNTFNTKTMTHVPFLLCTYYID